MLELRRAWAVLIAATLLAGYAPLFASQSIEIACCKNGHECCRRMHSGPGLRLEGDKCGLPGCGIEKAAIEDASFLPAAQTTVRPIAPDVISAGVGGKHAERLVQFALDR